MGMLLDLLDEKEDQNLTDLADQRPKTFDFAWDEKSIPYRLKVEAAEREHGIPKNLYARMLQQESKFNPKAKSNAGAEGIAQIVRKYHPGVDPYNVDQAIPYGAKYLRQLYDQFQDWGKAVAAYNEGPRATAEGRLPDETKEYVGRVYGGVEDEKGISLLDLIDRPRTQIQPKPIPKPQEFQGPKQRYDEAGNPIGKNGTPYPFISWTGKGVGNASVLFPITMSSLSDTDMKSFLKHSKYVGESFKSMPVTLFNSIASYLPTYWGPPILFGLHTYLTSLGVKGDPDIAKADADKVAMITSKYADKIFKIRNTKVGAAQEAMLTAPLSWPKLAFEYVSEVSKLKELAARGDKYIPTKVSKVMGHMANMATDLLSSVMALKGGHTGISGAGKIAERLNKMYVKSTAKEVARRKGTIDTLDPKAADNLVNEVKFFQEAREAQKSYDKLIRELVDENIAKDKAEAALVKMKESKTKAEGEKKVKIVKEKGKEPKVEIPVETSVETPEEIPSGPLPLTEENIVKFLEGRGYSKEDAIEMAKYDLESKDMDALDFDYQDQKGVWRSKSVNTIDEYGLYLDGLEEVKSTPTKKRSEPYTEVDEHIGTDKPEGLKGNESLFRDSDAEHTELMKRSYNERMNSVRSDPEVMTSYLINEVNRHLNGKEVDIETARNQLSEIAARADELQMMFEDPNDFRSFRDFVSEAAEWARKSDRPKIGRTASESTRMNTMIPLDKVPETVSRMIEEIARVSGGIRSKDLFRNREIYDQTGYWLGMDWRWRYEIDPDSFEYSVPRNPDTPTSSGVMFPGGPKKGPFKIGELLKGSGMDNLRRAIPSIDDITVKRDPLLKVNALYRARNKTISVRDFYDKSAVFHELSHAINSELGSKHPFLGTNTSIEIRRLHNERLIDILNQLEGLSKNEDVKSTVRAAIELAKEESIKEHPSNTLYTYFFDELLPELRKKDPDVIKEYDPTIIPEVTHMAAMERYMLNPGEMEARLVSERLSMSFEKRASEAPWETLDRMLSEENWLPNTYSKDYAKGGTKLYSNIPIDKAIESMMKVWHGAGKVIDKFHSLESAPFRTGEGAMARGAGLYVSSEHGVGKSYADDLGERPKVTYKGKEIGFSNFGTFLPNQNYNHYEKLLEDFASGEKSFKQFRDETIANIKADTEITLKGIRDMESELVSYERGGIPSDSKSVSTLKQAIKDDVALIDKLNESLETAKSFKENDFSKSLGKRALHEIYIPEGALWLDWDKPIKETLPKEKIEELRNAIGEQYMPDVQADIGAAIANLDSNPHYAKLSSEGKIVASSIVESLARTPTSNKFNSKRQEIFANLISDEPSISFKDLSKNDRNILSDLVVDLDKSDVSAVLTKALEYVNKETGRDQYINKGSRLIISKLITKAHLSEGSTLAQKRIAKDLLDNYNANPEYAKLTEYERSVAKRIIDKVKSEDLFNKLKIDEWTNGGELYRQIDKILAKEKGTSAGDIEASKFLRDLGFAGNMYRALSGKASYKNYVLFAPEKYARVGGVKLYSNIPIDQAIKQMSKSIDGVINYMKKARGSRRPTKEVATHLKEEFIRDWIERSGNIRRDLIKKYGNEGYEIVRKASLSKGSGALASMYLKQMNKEYGAGMSKHMKDVRDTRILAIRILDIAKSAKGKKFNYPENFTPTDAANYVVGFAQKEGLNPKQAEEIIRSNDAYFEWMKKPLKDAFEVELISEKEYNDLVTHNYRRLKPAEGTIEVAEVYDAKLPRDGVRRSIYDSGIEPLQLGKKTDIFEPSSEVMALEVFNRMYNRIANNLANRELWDFAHEKPDNPFVRVKFTKEQMAEKATEIRDRMKAEGATDAAIEGAINVLNAENKIPVGWKDTFVFVKGKRERMYLSPEMAKEWVTAGPEISYKTARLLRWASGAPIVRAFATGINWAFALANLPRDVMHIWYSARSFENGKWKPIYNSNLPVYGFQMARDIAATFSDALLRKGRYIDYLKEGGGLEFLVHQGRLFQRGRHVGSKTQKAMDFLGYMGETSEIMTRLAIRERALRQGKTPEEATFIARDYMDFNQGGGTAKAIDQAFPYFNATIVASRGIGRAMIENPISSAYKIAQLTALTTGIYIAAQGYAPETTQSLKGDINAENNLIIPFGDWFGFEDSKGQMVYPYLKLPLDTFQKFFKAVGEAGVDYHYGKDVDTTRIAQAFKQLSPVDLSALPPSAAGTLGYMANKDFWRMEDIWKQSSKEFEWRMPKALSGNEVGGSEEEYIPGKTPQAMVDLGKATGLSPERMKYFGEQIITKDNYFAGLLGHAYDQAFSDLPKKERQMHFFEALARTPVAKRFIGLTNPYSQHAKSIDDARQWDEAMRTSQKLGLDARAEGYLFYNNQTKSDVDRYINSFKDPDVRDRLEDRFQFQIDTKNLPNRSFWLRLQGLSTEARAKAYVDRLDKASPTDAASLRREEMIVDLAGGVLTDEFYDEVSKLRRGRDR